MSVKFFDDFVNNQKTFVICGSYIFKLYNKTSFMSWYLFQNSPER